MRHAKIIAIVSAVLVLGAGPATAAGILSLDKTPAVKSGGPVLDDVQGVLDCSAAVEVDLGVGVYNGDTTGLPDNVSSYGCSTWIETGGEVVYHVTFPADVTWEVSLSNMSCDLDLAVLDQCDEDLGCIAVVNSGAFVGAPSPGEYYFVVDGYDGAACSYAITFATTPWTPADFCALVEPTAGASSFAGSTCGGSNLVTYQNCGVYTENGLEDYYEVFMPSGSSFSADLMHSVDAAMWVLESCLEPFVCLAYADGAVGHEVISYTNTASVDRVVYLVIDSYGMNSCGDYTFTFDASGGAVAEVFRNFGTVKALYR